MNILFIHDKPSGGAGESLLQLVNSLKSNHQCSIIFMLEGFLKPKFDAIKSEVPQSYFPFTGTWLLNRDFGWSLVNYLRLFLALIPKIKLIRRIIKQAKDQEIQVIYTNTIYVIEGAIAARWLGIPHIWQVRELYDLEYYKYGVPKSGLTKILGWLSKYIICNSHRTKKVIQHFGGNIQKTKVIHNIVNPASENLDIRAKLEIPADCKTVCILGWVTPNKRVEDFIAVANRFSDSNIKFLIIGGFGGREDYNEKIKALLEESSNKANIIHTGIIPNAVNYLASIDLLLCPCFTESFGRTVGEALAAGTPAIGIKGSATQELIQENESGFLIEKGDVESLYQYTKQLLDSPELLESMGQNGKHFIKEQFSTKAIMPLYHQILKSL